MKNKLKAILCIIMALSLCFSASFAVYASDAGTEGEINVDDLLNLLSSLAGDSEGDAAEKVEGDFTDYTLNDITFSMPADWSMEEEDNAMSFFSPEFNAFASATLADNTGDEVDISNEEDLEQFKQTLGGDEANARIENITVCGYPALWTEAEVSDSGMQAKAYVVILPYNGSMFVLSLTQLGDGNPDDFAHMVNSITVSGAEGDTDISAAYDASVQPVSSTLTSGSDIIAEPEAAGSSDAKEIDATDMDEIVLVDNDICTVSIKNISTEDEYYAMTAEVFTENKTDVNLYFSFDDFSVNDYMCDPFWGTSVASGHKANSNLTFYTSDFEINGIETVRDMEFTLYVRDDDDWSADPMVEESFIVYPQGPDVPEQAPQEFDDSALVLLENEDCVMILKGFTEDDFYFSGELYLENRTDKAIDFSISGTTAVNGYEMNPYFIRTVQPGKKSNTSVHWYQDDLDTNGIDTVEEIEFDISISDTEDWLADPMYTTVQTVQLQ